MPTFAHSHGLPWAIAGMSQSVYLCDMNRFALFLIAAAVCAMLFIAIQFTLIWLWL
jgi:hypothetical protein